MAKNFSDFVNHENSLDSLIELWDGYNDTNCGILVQFRKLWKKKGNAMNMHLNPIRGWHTRAKMFINFGINT